jgi:hypothetical protein
VTDGEKATSRRQVSDKYERGNLADAVNQKLTDYRFLVSDFFA